MMNKELIIELEDKYNESREIEERLNFIEQQIIELQSFEESLRELSLNKEKNILSPIGKGVYVPAEVKDDKLFVTIGANIFIKKDVKSTEKILSEQADGLLKMKSELMKQMEFVQERMQKIISEIDKN